MGEVDLAFIQDSEHRPKLEVIEDEGIPVIDLDVKSDPGAVEGLVKEVGDACKKWGFFQVINHGVPLQMREKMEDTAREFFGQPAEEKRKVRRDEERPMGYYDTEHTKNVRDWKEVFDFNVEEPTLMAASHKADDTEVTKWFNQWPQHPTDLREICQEYAKEMEKLARKLLELIALSLGLPGDKFHCLFKDQTTRIRLNHYPPCPVPELALGVGRHKDSSALTILAQDDVGGLQVKRKTDGEWIQVKPTPNSYIINIGDIIQVLSNDAYESVEHRVMVNSRKERFSIPCFFGPAHYAMIEPVEELITEQNPAKYKPYSWGKFLATRMQSNFKKLDVENIQIDHFRLSDLGHKLDNALVLR